MHAKVTENMMQYGLSNWPKFKNLFVLKQLLSSKQEEQRETLSKKVKTQDNNSIYGGSN